jgi:hypothetical protein
MELLWALAADAPAVVIVDTTSPLDVRDVSAAVRRAHRH